MSPDQLLTHFAKLDHVLGMALLTHDGVVIASSFDDPECETLAALASQFLKQMKQGAHQLGLASFRHLSLRALRGSLFFVCLDELVLVVVGKPTQEPSEVWSKIEEAMMSLPRMSRV